MIVVVDEWNDNSAGTGQGQVRTDKQPVGTRGDKAIDKILGVAAINLIWRARSAQLTVKAWVVDVYI